MKTEKRETGDRGEQAACGFLESQGHRILRRNWQDSHLELDIITVKDNILHVVEVKTRSAGAPVAPEINVNARKRRRLVRAAGDFLHSETLRGIDEVHFDIVTVVFQAPAPIVEYYPQAFIPVYF